MRMSDWSSDGCSSDLRAGAFVLYADHDAVGPLEILDGRAFAQEFGVGGDGELRVGIGFADDAVDLVSRADRDGGLGDDAGEAAEVGRDLLRGGIDIAKVGMRSEEHTSELQSLMRISYAVFCLKKQQDPAANQ